MSVHYLISNPATSYYDRASVYVNKSVKEESPDMGHKGAQHPAGKPKPGQARPAAPKKK